jgi:hypothetical protein
MSGAAPTPELPVLGLLWAATTPWKAHLMMGWTIN